MNMTNTNSLNHKQIETLMFEAVRYKKEKPVSYTTMLNQLGIYEAK